MSELTGDITPEKANELLKKYAARLDGIEPDDTVEPETALTREQVFELMAYLEGDIRRMQTDILTAEDTLEQIERNKVRPTIH